MKTLLSNKPCKMMPADLVVDITEHKYVKPHSESAKKLCNLWGGTHFTPAQITIAKSMGFAFHVRQSIVEL